MNLEEAKELLNGCVRSELRDHSFGDAEVFWIKDGKEIAGGYFGGGLASVSVTGAVDDGTISYHFEDSNAKELRECGEEGDIDRNDESGPETYQEGVTAPGLTKEGVFKELTEIPETMEETTD